MCGILGAFNYNETNFKKMLIKQKHRGPNNSKYINFNNLLLGQNLLAIVNYIEQPIVYKNYAFATNCEIYNWKELSKKENIIAENDSEFLFKFLIKHKLNIKKALKKINGDYAFAFIIKENNSFKGYLARDILGVKPLWYYNTKNNFLFASERKTLPINFRKNAIDLNPRILLEINFNNLKTKEIYRGFYKYKQKNIEYINAKNKTEKLLINSIRSRIANKKTAILLSGGVDSSLIAKISEKYFDPIFYNISINKNNEDYIYTKKLETVLKNKIKYIQINEKKIISAIPKIIKIIETSDPVKVAIAMPMYFIAKQAKKDNIKVVLIGTGADSLFCGFFRFFKEYNPTKDTISKLRKIYDTDCYRDDTIFMNFGIEPRFPYLDKNLINFVLQYSDNYKIKEDVKKYILRDIAKKYLPEEIAFRKKKAIQYGSGFDKILSKYIKEKKEKTRGHLLRKNKSENEKLGCLFSGGKDSVLALQIMLNSNYKVPCLITLISKNKDSYMFHTPTINLVDLQAKALNINLIKQNTLGHKELEIKDLEKALKKARKKYKINGIITGAIFSTYQRDRIELICDKLGLKVFSPLWHKDQYLELTEVLALGNKVIITKIAGYGLNKKYLGKIIDKELLEELKNLNNKIGFNIAGEGGEYETLVIDSNIFKNKLNILNTEIKEIDEYTFELIINDAKLEMK